MTERERIYKELVKAVIKKGFPEELGIAIAENLRTEKTMQRMIGYLKQVKKASAEDVVDEMLAIMDDRERWVKKKTAEYYNRKYNELLYYGLGNEEEDV